MAPHIGLALLNLSGFVSLFLYATFGTKFISGLIVTLFVSCGAALTCIALFDPGPFFGVIRVFWSRILATVWNFLNGLWIGYSFYVSESDKILVPVAELALAVTTFSVLLLYAVEDDDKKKARKEESKKAKADKAAKKKA